MRSPKNMRNIQIDITNACVLECSNCTRFCGHHKKPYFMEVDDVKRAIDSLEDFQGTVAFIGGEPTLHPQFEEIARYLASKYPHLENTDDELLHPQENFVKTMSNLVSSYTRKYEYDNIKTTRAKVPGLWSLMGKKYEEHYEVIQDVFKYQVLNDHGNEMFHDPLLVSRKDLGIPDDEWEVIRDNCWIQNEWSASITPKGAFFCEVAGTLDMLFDGPGGWKVEPGWWKREVSDFKEQLNWCEICGAACDTYTRNANDSIDDISPSVFEKLKKVDSKKLKTGKYFIMDIDENGKISEESKASTKRFTEGMPYAESADAKFNPAKCGLFPKEFEAVMIIDKHFIEKNTKEINKEINKEKIKDFENILFKQFKMTYFIFENLEIENSFMLNENYAENDVKWKSFNMEKNSINEIMQTFIKPKNKGVYTAVFSSISFPQIDFVDNLKKNIFNPGALLYSGNHRLNKALNDNLHVNNFVEETTFMIFNGSASSLKEYTGDFSEINSLMDLQKIWKTRKVIEIDENLFSTVSRNPFKKNKRYVVYGAGIRCQKTIDFVKENHGEVAFLADTNEEKQKQEFLGYKVYSPEEVLAKSGEFDFIIISSEKFYDEIKNTLFEKGFYDYQILPCFPLN